jgi:PKD repeat protein
VINNGRQDYANYYDHTREFTLEISNTKTPTANTLPNYWNYNYRSFLNYTQQATYGIHGVVTDACSGEPLYAKVFINSHDVNESYVMTDPRVGYYARPIKAGTYSVTYSADGYDPQTVSITVADRQKVVKNIVLGSATAPNMPPVADFTADITVIEEGKPTIVHFSDMTENCPDGWLWYFEEGTPETSTEQNPVITYNGGKSAKSRFLGVKLTASNAYGTDINFKEEFIEVGLSPVTEFTADPTTVLAGQSVSFFDMTENEPTLWGWRCEGGTPDKSTEQNPVIIYKYPGIYPVSLTTKNKFGEHSITKENYITVTATSLPIADFEADKTKIYENKTVNFTDLSINATAWKWYFEGGTPETSTEQNPTILYKNTGIYSVTLVAENEAGKDSITKENYITVVETSMPIADFVADETHITAGESVHFTNLSENATTWEWYFEGGTPETSTEENPTVLYENAGDFDVKLTVTNADGSDALLKENYITVDNVSISETEGFRIKVFPNPVSRGATITVDADSPLRKIEWISMSGALIKTVYANAASCTFSVSGIEQGAYLLKIETQKGISVTKIQVQ